MKTTLTKKKLSPARHSLIRPPPCSLSPHLQPQESCSLEVSKAETPGSGIDFSRYIM